MLICAETAMPKRSRANGKLNENGRDRRRQEAIALSDRALKHHDAGRYAKAEPLYRQALAIHEDLDGHHPEHAVALNNLALLLQQTGRYAEAGRPLWRLLEICRSVFRERSAEYATALHK
jgi:tetratricopeptide (TPR) repeat protein